MGRSLETVLGIAATIATLLTVTAPAEAQGILIRDPFINEAGDLELEFSQRTLARVEMFYRARSVVDLTSVCVDGARRPLPGRRYRQTIHVTVERTLPIAADFSGQVLGFLTLYAPKDEVTLACPAGTIAETASVRFTDVEIRNQAGGSGVTRNITRTFFRLP